jgi:hypothetical protein
MPAGVSEVSICNEALIQIDRNTITSLTADTSNEAIACNRIYTQVRDQMLRSHPWNFATARESLQTLASSDPLSEFDNIFQLPNDFLRVVKLYDTTSRYKIEGSTLLTDDSTAKLIYIKRETDTTKFDSIFVEALALKLAIRLAYALSGSTTRIEQLRAEFKKVYAEAKRVDGQEGTHDTMQPNLFIDTHGGSNIDWTNI